MSFKKLSLLSLLLLTSCTALNQRLGLADDHPIEEIGELIIHHKVGVDLDLSPSSPE